MDDEVVTLPDATVALVLNGNGKTQVVIPPDQTMTPFGWGIVLNDIARNAARAMVGENLGDQVEFLTELKRGFDAEWENPTDWPRVK